MTVRGSFVLSIVLVGCSAPPAPARAPVADGTGAAVTTAAPVDDDEPASGATVPTGDDTVEARVVDSGPIGDGRCTQCSHRIVVDASLAGTIAAGPDPMWVHYERCEGDPAPDPASINPCSMKKGAAYTLALRRGASENFGDEPMILDARPR